MKKLKAILAAICLVTTVGAQPAFAANTTFDFSFSSINDIQSSYNDGVKDDNDSKWYISLDRKNRDTGISNTMSSSNIFGAKIHKTYADNISRYTTFSNYVSGYGIRYNSSVHQGETMYLSGQKDDASTSSAELRISGRFAP